MNCTLFIIYIYIVLDIIRVKWCGMANDHVLMLTRFSYELRIFFFEKFVDWFHDVNPNCRLSPIEISSSLCLRFILGLRVKAFKLFMKIIHEKGCCHISVLALTTLDVFAKFLMDFQTMFNFHLSFVA